MAEYIKNLIKKIREEKHIPQEYVALVANEFQRLDPRDFEPEVQHEVAWLGARLRILAAGSSRLDHGTIDPAFDLGLSLVEKYRGCGSRGAARSFKFLADGGLRTIIERDYTELKLKLFPSGAWKSTVIIAGSVLEAILFDRLADPLWNVRAIASAKAPKKSGVPLQMDEWKLVNLIDVAVNIGRLPKDPADTIHQALRDYRNFVHPMKEIRAAHDLSEAEAMLAIGALDSVCNYFDKNP